MRGLGGQRWYHILMKWFCTFALGVLAVAFGAIAAVNAQLKQVTSVYILSMGSGMDQYIATQLAKAGVVKVVTDPQKADAILTDHVGESFEAKLDQLYPPPPKPEPPKKADESTKEAGKHNADMSGGGAIHVTSSSFGGSKGNFFLVDRKTRAVLWSVYEPSKDTTPNALTKTATKLVKRLETDFSDKK
jgi:hypothetical protein